MKDIRISSEGGISKEAGLQKRNKVSSRIGSILLKNRYIIAIIIVGSIYRLYSLGSIPQGVWSDEIVPWAGTLHFINNFSLLYNNITIITYLEIIFDGLFLSIKMLGPSTLSGRLPGAIIGILLIPLTYRIAVELSNRRIALFASTLAALNPLGIQASRVFYMQQPLVSVFYMSLGVYLILSGVNKNKLYRILAAIILFGITMVGAFSNQTTFTSLILLIALMFWGFFSNRENVSLEKRVTIFLIAPFLVFIFFTYGLNLFDSFYMKKYVYMKSLNYNSLYFGSFNIFISKGIYGLPIFFKKYLLYFTPNPLFFYSGPDPSVGLNHAGAMLYVELPFFYFGLFLLFFALFARRVKRSDKFPYILLLLWILSSPVEVSVYSLSSYTPWSLNFISSLPALNIIAAFGFIEFLYILEHRFIFKWNVWRGTLYKPGENTLHYSSIESIRTRRFRKAAYAIFIAGLMISSSIFAYYYFDEHSTKVIDDPNSQWGVFYGFPEVARVSGLIEEYYSNYSNGTGYLPIYLYSGGFFNDTEVWGNQSSAFSYYYFSGAFTDYFYYYSNGVIKKISTLSGPSFFINKTSLIVTSEPALVKDILIKEGYEFLNIYTVYRPDGVVALSLIEVKVGITSSQSEFLHNSLFAYEINPYEGKYLNFTNIPNTTNFTIAMNITVKSLNFYKNYSANPIIFVLGNYYLSIGIRMIPTNHNESIFNYYWNLFLRYGNYETWIWGQNFTNKNNEYFTVLFTVTNGLGFLFVNGMLVAARGGEVVYGIPLGIFTDLSFYNSAYISVNSIVVFKSLLNYDEIAYLFSTEWNSSSI